MITASLDRQTDLFCSKNVRDLALISTPSGLDAIFIFTGDGGEKHGYADDFGDDGIFYYTGEGQEGDMEMVRGNKAILNNMKDGRTIHIFEYVRKAYVRYNGSLKILIS